MKQKIMMWFVFLYPFVILLAIAFYYLFSSILKTFIPIFNIDDKYNFLLIYFGALFFPIVGFGGMALKIKTSKLVGIIGVLMVSLASIILAVIRLFYGYYSSLILVLALLPSALVDGLVLIKWGKIDLTDPYINRSQPLLIINKSSDKEMLKLERKFIDLKQEYMRINDNNAYQQNLRLATKEFLFLSSAETIKKFINKQDGQIKNILFLVSQLGSLIFALFTVAWSWWQTSFLIVEIFDMQSGLIIIYSLLGIMALFIDDHRQKVFSSIIILIMAAVEFIVAIYFLIINIHFYFLYSMLGALIPIILLMSYLIFNFYLQQKKKKVLFDLCRNNGDMVNKYIIYFQNLKDREIIVTQEFSAYMSWLEHCFDYYNLAK